MVGRMDGWIGYGNLCGATIRALLCDANNTMFHLEMGLHVVLVSFPAAATVKDSITDRTLISVIIVIIVGHSLQHKRSFCLISYSFPPRTFSLDVLYFHFGGEKT